MVSGEIPEKSAGFGRFLDKEDDFSLSLFNLTIADSFCEKVASSSLPSDGRSALLERLGPSSSGVFGRASGDAFVKEMGLIGICSDDPDVSPLTKLEIFGLTTLATTLFFGVLF